MSKKMLINATHPEEHRVAIVEDGVLSELDIEITGKEQTKGNVYKAVVVRVETGLQAAFVDYGGERPGFLQIGEIHPSFHKADPSSETKGRPRITDMLRRGQEILVQVVKEERGTKGAALTTYLSLPGRYMVLMPESDTKGISRKIEQESTRKKLKQAMSSMDLPENIGYIVRTAGIGQKKTELKRDVDYLIRVYEKICELGKQVKAPALVYKESNLVIRLIRDYFSPDIDEVLVDDPRVAQEGKDFFQAVMPEYAQLVKLHQERRPIFSRYQIEEQIEALHRNKVPLPSGGSIVIDSTEALVAIDVNSGKMATEKGVEATAFKSNMEAAAEAARQLRLRDLGGLIVIDFIDMRDRKHIRDVEKCLKDALKNDKARVSVGRISQFGLLEMSRQRIKAALAEASYLPCPHCEGSGRIKSAEAQALNFVRRLSAGMAKGQIGRVEGQVPLEVAAYLLNNKRAELIRLEQQYNATIYIKGCAEMTDGQIEVEFLRREKEEQKSIQNYVEASSGRDESPQESPADKETGEEEAEVETETSPRPSGRKRRRPRRRRKPAETTADHTTETTELTEGETATTQPPVEQQDIGSSPAAAAPADNAPVTADTGGTSSTPTVQPGTEEQKPEQTTPQPATSEPATPATDEPTSAKPRPRRRKPAAAKKAAPTETKTDTISEPAAEPAEPKTEAEAVSVPVAEAPKPKAPRRRRTPAAKKPLDKEQSAQSEPPASAVEEPKDDQDKPEEKPKRRRTRKPAAKKPTVEVAEQTPQTAAAEVAPPKVVSEENEPAAAEPKKKPARRGRPRKKPAAEEPVTAAADKAEPKPKPRKKTAVKESPKGSETDAE
jgi:ribonuclease E